MLRGERCKGGALVRDDRPHVCHSRELNDLRKGDDGTHELGEAVSEVVVHQRVDKSVQKHATLFGTRQIHYMEEKEECSGVVIEVEEVNVTQSLSVPNVNCGIEPLPNL